MAVTDDSVNGTREIEQLEGTIELEHSPQGDKEPETSLEENETTVEPDKLTIEPWPEELPEDIQGEDYPLVQQRVAP